MCLQHLAKTAINGNSSASRGTLVSASLSSPGWGGPPHKLKITNCRQRPFVKILHLYLDVSTFLSWFLAHNRFFAQNSPKIHKFTPLHLQLRTGERKTKGCRVSPSDAPFQVTNATIRFFLPNFRTRTVQCHLFPQCCPFSYCIHFTEVEPLEQNRLEQNRRYFQFNSNSDHFVHFVQEINFERRLWAFQLHQK